MPINFRAAASTLLAVMLLAIIHRPAGADAVDDLVKAEMEKRHIPGLSVAVVQKGQVVKLAGYGLANVELNVPATQQTVFQIQSITKTFTAAGILMLMEEGKLSLDDPVSKHVDGTPDAWKAITLRHLLTHTSGIKDFINEPTVSLRLDVTEEQVLRDTAPRPLNFMPGDRYAYSNTNYHLLAMIIRRHTGMGYGDFLKARIFTPLGMNDTRIMSHSAIIPNRASGYHWRNNALRNGDFVADSILGYGGGGIISTAADMARWAAAFDSEKLLKRATIEQAWTAAKFNNGKTSGYGLGWGIASVAGHRSVEHSGGHSTGFVSNLILFPDDALAVVVLANSTSANTGTLSRRIAGVFNPSLAPKPAQPIEDKEPKVTALLRDCIARAGEGKLEAGMFTPEMWKVVVEQQAGMKQTLAAVGALKSLDLLSRNESGGLRSYRYRATFASETMTITVALNAENKIAGMFHAIE